VSRCRNCGHAIVWCRTEAGKSMPVNAEIDPGGRVEMLGFSDRGDQLIRVWQAPGGPVGMDLHRSHFATCPHASSGNYKVATRIASEHEPLAPPIHDGCTAIRVSRAKGQLLWGDHT